MAKKEPKVYGAPIKAITVAELSTLDCGAIADAEAQGVRIALTYKEYSDLFRKTRQMPTLEEDNKRHRETIERLNVKAELLERTLQFVIHTAINGKGNPFQERLPGYPFRIG